MRIYVIHTSWLHNGCVLMFYCKANFTSVRLILLNNLITSFKTKKKQVVAIKSFSI